MPQLRGASGFVGLKNQCARPSRPTLAHLTRLARRGATCYLNSLIQALYLTPEFRAGLFAIDPHALNVDAVSAPPCVAPTARVALIAELSARVAHCPDD